MQRRIPAVYMRGGTSKGLYINEKFLPEDTEIRDQVILSAFGSPDPGRRQLDGMGGGTSTTSKLAIISQSKDPEYDVVYEFGQVSIDRPLIDRKGNCGNISAGVGPFAIEQGLVEAVEPITNVRILQKNTNKLIIAEVPVKDGRYDEEGDFYLDGVPFPGAKITMHYVDPGGSITGKLLPTDNMTDTIATKDHGNFEVTILDASNPVVFVAAKSLGIKGTEIEEIDADETVQQKLEQIRGQAAVMLGLVKTAEDATLNCQAIPKMAMVAPAQTYTSLGGEEIKAEDIDLTVRIMSMGTLHRAFAVSGAICTVGAAAITGTIVHQALEGKEIDMDAITLGHPGGIIEVGAKLTNSSDHWHYESASTTRSARIIMEGSVCVAERFFS